MQSRPSSPTCTNGFLPARRVAFWLYAAALFIATHWPRLDVRVPGVERSDLFMHAGAFVVWYWLLVLTAYFGPAHRPFARSLLRPWLAAMAYAVIDESLQLIPALGRHAAWDDLLADFAGITFGLIAAWSWVVFRASPARQQRSAGEQSAA